MCVTGMACLAAVLVLDRFVYVPYGFLSLHVLLGSATRETPARPCGWDYEANWSIYRTDRGPLGGGDNVTATPAKSCWGMHGIHASFVADPMAVIPDELPALQRALPPPAASLWYLFYEAKDLATGLGVIAVSTSADQGRTWADGRVVLREPFHLSYPLIKVHEPSGQVLMLPETSAVHAVSLYATSPAEFPHGWRLVKRPLSGRRFADTSPVFFQGMWYIFTWYKWRLKLYYAKDLLEGPWLEHAAPSLYGTSLLNIPQCEPLVARAHH